MCLNMEKFVFFFNTNVNQTHPPLKKKKIE